MSKEEDTASGAAPDLKTRTKRFALAVIELCSEPPGIPGDLWGLPQVLPPP